MNTLKMDDETDLLRPLTSAFFEIFQETEEVARSKLSTLTSFNIECYGSNLK